MKLSVTHKHDDSRDAVEASVANYSVKLGRLLKSFAPDLVQLHGSFEKHPRKVEYTFSLNLSLPTGSFHSTGVASDVRSSVKAAFTELESQLKKHLAKLRRDVQWKRKRPRSPLPA